MSSTMDATTLTRPRLLCLHGGGTNARIFATQCRALSRALAPHFRLVYAEAPFDSLPGPDVLSVYAEWGPFKRWLPEGEGEETADGERAGEGKGGVGGVRDKEAWERAAIAALDESLQTAMDEDDGRGATGEWVGVLGFSQGAKMAGSLLLRQQMRGSAAESSWKFGVLLAGRAPLVCLEPGLGGGSRSSMLGRLGQPQGGLAGPARLEDILGEAHVLRVRTLHVHGLADPGLSFHRELAEEYCGEAGRVVEWEGAHRVPLRSGDVGRVVEGILGLWGKVGEV